jgi:SAM-dependent methyltransferase
MICGNEKNNNLYTIREMMLGTRDEFRYTLCNNCGCMQQENPPKDISRYYPSNYLCFKVQSYSRNPLKKIARLTRDRIFLESRGIMGKIAAKIHPLTQGRDVYRAVGRVGIKKNTSILEIGCGAGEFLRYMYNELGYENSKGIDPFLPEQLLNDDVKFEKKSAFDLDKDEKYDLILMNHSLEHIPEQAETMKAIASHMNATGVLVVRIPVISKPVWEEYRENWVQIDAPRHYFIHSLDSFTLLSEKSGFVIEDFYFDSTEFLSWGSEQYKKDIPLHSEETRGIVPRPGLFSQEDMNRFLLKAEKLNSKNQGDQATFYLRLAH